MFTPLYDTFTTNPKKVFVFIIISIIKRFNNQRGVPSSALNVPRAEGFANNHLSIFLSHLIFNTTTGIFWESLNHLHFSIPKSVFETAHFLCLWPVSAEASLARAYHSSTSFSSWAHKNYLSKHLHIMYYNHHTFSTTFHHCHFIAS